MRLGLAALIFLHLQGLGAPEPQYIHVPDGFDHIVERDYDNVNIPIQEGSEQQPAKEQGYGPPLYTVCQGKGGRLTVDCKYKCDYGQCYVNASSMCHVEQQGGGYSRQWQSIYAPQRGRGGRTSSNSSSCEYCYIQSKTRQVD